MLRSSKGQAFFGAPLIEFPHLGKDYIEWFVAKLSFADELDDDKAYQRFADVAYRPEVFGAAVDALVFDLDVKKGQHAKRFRKHVQEPQTLIRKLTRS
jgi:hypothetical protein